MFFADLLITIGIRNAGVFSRAQRLNPKSTLANNISALVSSAPLQRPMLRSYSALVFVFGLLAASASPQSTRSPLQAGVATITAESGHVFFTVTDDRGNTLPAPSKNEVRIRLGGQRTEVEAIRSLASSPLFFEVLVDVSGSSSEYEGLERALALQLFRELSTGGNQGHLILFSQEASGNDQPDDVATVDARLKASSPLGMTALYDGVVFAATRPFWSTISEESPRAIFILSDGNDNYSHARLSDAIAHLQREGIPVFSYVLLDPFPFTPTDTAIQIAPLTMLADATGGSSLAEANGQTSLSVAKRLVSLASSQSVAYFKLPALPRGKTYDLKLDSTKKGIHFSAQKEYFLQ